VSLTYYRRNKWRALPILLMLFIAILGLILVASVLNSLNDTSLVLAAFHKRVSVVAAVEGTLDPAVVTRIKAHPDVQAIYFNRGQEIPVDLLFGRTGFMLFGVSEEDMLALMDLYEARVQAGRLPRPRTNEFAVSEEIARGRGWNLGSQMGGAINRDDWLPGEFVLVGLLESPERIGFLSAEYLGSDARYAPQSPGLLVVAREGCRPVVDRFLQDEIASGRIPVATWESVLTSIYERERFLNLSLGFVAVLLVAVIAMAGGFIIYIYFAQRLDEFAVFQALGYSRGQVIRRVLLETLGLTGLAWTVGTIMGLGLLAGLVVAFYEPRGLTLNWLDPSILWFTLPLPLSVTLASAIPMAWSLSHLDPVAVIERQDTWHQPPVSCQSAIRNPQSVRTRNLPSFIIYYRRHKWRALLLLGMLTIAILGVTLIGAVLNGLVETVQDNWTSLKRVTIVSPVEGSFDPALVAQIRSHPNVEAVYHCRNGFTWVRNGPAYTTFCLFGTAEEDTQALVTAYEARVQEGRLPRPHTNEFAASEEVVRAMGISLGGKIGRAVNHRDPLPGEFVLVGILTSPERIGFLSYEFLNADSRYANTPPGLLVVPKDGQKAAVDRFLSEVAHSGRVELVRYDDMLAQILASTIALYLLTSLVEIVFIVIVAVACGSIGYLNFRQRRGEFAMRHALGYRRIGLISQSLAEAAGLAGVAWIGAEIGGMVTLAWLAVTVYEPQGMVMSWLNPALWLLTLPIPVLVTAAGVLPVAWSLSRMDPISIIERQMI